MAARRSNSGNIGSARGSLTAGSLTAGHQPAHPARVLRPGVHAIGPDPASEDSLLYVPSSYSADSPAPLILTLHGAGGDARNGLVPLQQLADSAGLLLLSPSSREQTWDVIMHDYGEDVGYIDGLVIEALQICRVDPSHVAIEGFSDGASYALSLGISNGDLFTHIIAFSPGFIHPARQQGAPRVFISHGTGDTVLPIGTCSHRIVPQLESAGYDLTYREFKGGHTVPNPIAREAVSWFLNAPQVQLF